MIKSPFWFVANLFVLASLAAGYVDDYYYACRGTPKFDASLKGNVSSPMYGKRSQYPPNLNCAYKIIAPFGHKIKITFKDFDVVPSVGCQQDMLSIYERKFEKIVSVWYCGQELPRPVLSQGNEVTLRFVTDFMQGGRGYLLEYESGPDMQLCDSGLRQCHNRNCYEPKKECDGEDDCGDGTDEENCSHPLAVIPAECGTPAIPPRISRGADRMVGGEEVIPNSWPWQVSLQTKSVEPNDHFCGGTLINAMWVLTSAVCVVGYVAAENMRVVLGSHGKFTTAPYQQVRYVDRVIPHPEVKGRNGLNYTTLHDIFLLRLNAPVELNAGVQPACLPDWGSNPKPGSQCYATGWGQTRGSGSSHALKQTLQFVKSHEECREYLNHVKVPVVSDEASQLCVGNTGQYICNDDEGGPLQCKVKNKWYVMGVISFPTLTHLEYRGALCGGRGAKTFYASTALDYDWIIDTIVKNSKI